MTRERGPDWGDREGWLDMETCKGRKGRRKRLREEGRGKRIEINAATDIPRRGGKIASVVE